MNNTKQAITGVNRRQLSNNTQRVALRLLNANGEWVSRAELSRNVSSAAARVRDLRKGQFGGFSVDCASASSLNKRGDQNSFFYRIQPRSVTKTQIKTIFRQ